MKQLTHGGDWAGYRAEFGRDPLDFSANVSPLGLPGGVAKAITASLATADRYPDPLCRALREKLAVAEGVPAEWLLCTHLRRVRHGAGNCGLQGRTAFSAGGKRFCGDGRHP